MPIRRQFNNVSVHDQVGGKVYRFRSLLEYRWAKYLELLRISGHLLEWQYEPKTFYFQNVTRAPVQYKPDFRTVEPDGSVIWHETKGYFDGPTVSKLQRMHQHYPEETFDLILDGMPRKGKSAARILAAQKYTRRIYDGRAVLRQAGL